MKANDKSGTGASKSISVLFVLLVVAVTATVAGFWQLNRQGALDREYIVHAGEMRVLSQQIATSAREAATGKAEAFDELLRARNEFQRRYGLLFGAIEPSSAAILPSAVRRPMDGLSETWARVQDDAESIISNRETVLALHEVAATLAEIIPQLQVQNDDVVQALVDDNTSAKQITIAQGQSLRAERILSSISRVLEEGQNAVVEADNISQEARLYRVVLNGLLEGNTELDISKVSSPEAITLLKETADLFTFVSGAVEDIQRTSVELFLVSEASDSILRDSQTLLQNTSSLTSAFEALSRERGLLQGNEYTVIVPGAVALISILMIGWVMVRDTRRRYRETAASNELNQTAILRLLDELADLADGDLTVSATVSEDFTGAIADSINFSIEQLRTLVDTINQTAVSVAGAADETQNTAHHLAQAAEHQAREISGASAAINEMAVSIDQVSANAKESSAVAERSVEIAKKGNKVVQNTIAGMDTIREQIQDTSKRIKRLGESSQEIGDIVSLINEIADQTNILALNAAIQASMAGSAGRGFAVVADEVQRLAERASAATRQIEGLVKTIQTDTNEAVISMEQTTTEVVRGASLAQDAGVSLEEIETVSRTLSELISNISRAASQQAASAGHVSSTMRVIQEITTQTSAGTNATAHSVGHLADMASNMRESVSGFKLPERIHETSEVV